MRHGFLLIDKPVGPTSHDIVGSLRRTLGEKSIGHLGTLDPEASGLMVLAVGAKALKIVELYNGLEKEYEGEIHFGAVSTTYDAQGVITEQEAKPGVEIPEQGTLQRIIADRFTGKINQVPPAFSAVHIEGKRAYDMARAGKEVVMPIRSVEISDYRVISYNYPILRVSVRCSAGTYIRSLAHDLGQTVRLGAYLASLRRTKVGEWDVKDAITLEKASWTDVMPLKDILQSRKKVEITAQQYQMLQHGKDLPMDVSENTIAWCEGLPVAILCESTKEQHMAHPRKVF